jgi:hypothetical protein
MLYMLWLIVFCGCVDTPNQYAPISSTGLKLYTEVEYDPNSDNIVVTLTFGNEGDTSLFLDTSPSILCTVLVRKEGKIVCMRGGGIETCGERTSRPYEYVLLSAPSEKERARGLRSCSNSYTKRFKVEPLEGFTHSECEYIFDIGAHVLKATWNGTKNRWVFSRQGVVLHVIFPPQDVLRDDGGE